MSRKIGDAKSSVLLNPFNLWSNVYLAFLWLSVNWRSFNFLFFFSAVRHCPSWSRYMDHSWQAFVRGTAGYRRLPDDQLPSRSHRSPNCGRRFCSRMLWSVDGKQNLTDNSTFSCQLRYSFTVSCHRVSSPTPINVTSNSFNSTFPKVLEDEKNCQISGHMKNVMIDLCWGALFGVREGFDRISAGYDHF